MKINPGDKVSFLNEKGGGIVKKLVNKIAYIEIEDGFEIPVPINELIVNVSQKKSIDEQPLKKESESNEKIPITESRLHVNNVTYKKNEGVYIAYIPEDKYNILDSGLNIYIVNNTEYSLFYSFNHNFENKYEQVSSGIVNQLSKVHIKKIERDTIEKWCEGVIQILFFKKKTDILLSPISKNIKIKALRLFKEDNYKYYDFIDKEAFVHTITSKVSEQSPVLWDEEMLNEVYQEDFNESEFIRKKTTKRVDSLVEKHRINPDTMEVDLHIGELVDDFSKMSNGEIINIQISYFIRCLEAAISNHISKVYFIHGVGNGVLKSEVRKYLQTYTNLYFEDAPMKKYGVGATEVHIYNK